jgi:hypothetical protein
MERAGSLQPMPVPPRNSGMADTLDEAKAALANRYQALRGGQKAGEVRGRNAAGFPAMKSVPRLTAEQRRALARLAAVGRTSPDLQVALRLGPPRRAVALPTRADRLCADFLRAI